MAAILLVDGHSVIFGIASLRQMHEVRQSIARDALVRRLEDYGVRRGVHVVVVFDGRGSRGESERSGSVQILYGASADSVIERLVAKYADVHELTVVSNDLMERQTVTTLGAFTLPVSVLERDLDSMERDLAREIQRRRKVR
jgi:predicted RNA-binding protein with PIN domain